MSYSIRNSRGDAIATIAEKEVDNSTSLVLHGRGYSPYGTRRNENLVHLLENFSSTTAPTSPVDGQLWWDNTILQVWDTTLGSPLGVWREVVPPSAGLGFDVVAGDGLTGGGFPAGSPLSVTINVGAGTGITVQGSPGLVSTNDSQIDHDSLSGFVANEHIDHSSVVFTAGKGLVGGLGSPAFSSTNDQIVTLDIDNNPGAGSYGNTSGVTTPQPFDLILPVNPDGTGGNTLAYRVDLILSYSGGGGGMEIYMSRPAGVTPFFTDFECFGDIVFQNTSGTVTLSTADIGSGGDLDQGSSSDTYLLFPGAIPAAIWDGTDFNNNRTVTFKPPTAGSGSVTGDMTADWTLAVGLGDGIDTTLGVVHTDTTVWRTWVAAQTDSVKIFTSPILGDNTTTAAAPAYGFDIDFDNGIYKSGTDELSFSTAAVQRFRIESNGVLRSLNSSYESLVTSDDVIPNKKYVDNIATSGGFPTGNIFVGTNNISGLNPDRTYLVNGYGTIRSAGTSVHYMYPIYLRRGSTTPGVGTIVASTPGQNINWPDGAPPVTVSFVCEMNGDTAVNFYMDSSMSLPDHGPALYMTAMQIDADVVGSPIPGSPLPSVGSIELDDLPAAIYAGTFYGGPYKPLASLKINSNGDGETATGSTAAFLIYSQFGNDWLVSGGPASAFEVRATEVSITGSNYTKFGTLSTWQPLSSSRFWSLERSTFNPGINQWTLDIEIREIANIGNTTGVETITMTCEQII